MKDKLLGPLESKVMNYFWGSRNPHDISQLHSHLNKTDHLAYTTVSTIVGRLVEKKLLSRRKEGHGFIYHARSSQEDFLAGYARRAIKGLIGNFGDVAIAGFVEEIKNDPKNLRMLKEIADE
jgi:predicted transcriptional regulator